MNCPHCDTHIDEHEATRCLDAWIAEAIMGWKPYFIISYNILYPPNSQHSCDEYPYIYKDHRPDKPYEFDSEHFYASDRGGYTQPIVPKYSTDISVAKRASDKAGSAVIFAPNSCVRDGSYANRKKDWLVEMIPHKGTTDDAVWAYGETEELARCCAAIKVSKNA